MQLSPIVSFGIDDLQIRGLMRFIEITNKESKNEDDVQVTSVQITKGGSTQLKRGLNSFLF